MFGLFPWAWPGADTYCKLLTMLNEEVRRQSSAAIVMCRKPLILHPILSIFFHIYDHMLKDLFLLFGIQRDPGLVATLTPPSRYRILIFP